MSEYIDYSSGRKEDLKQIIRQLHEGRSVEEVQHEFAAVLEDVGAMDIAQIEQELIEEGMPETEIQRLCDVHVAVFRQSLEAAESPDTVPGHPVYTFLAENAAAGRVLDALEDALEALKAEPSLERLERARTRLRELREYERHYVRKENVLFPYLEKHGFGGPSTVMWGIHDEIRQGWKELEALLSEGPGGDLASFSTRIGEVFDPLATAIREMFYKEENILYPTALEKLSGDEWWQIRVQSPDVGYCYVTPGDQWPPEETALERVWALDKGDGPRSSEGLLHLDTGTLTPMMVNLLLNHLPIEISFVDAEDTVRFFTQTGERIFPRSPAVIGRKVQKCHPPASVHKVEQILDDFRAGQRDEAEFWIQMGPPDAGKRFIHIRYFAVRDDHQAYRGTLEVVQDVTYIRELEGERRLLDEA
jgi:DUF438 domain-containing protein